MSNRSPNRILFVIVCLVLVIGIIVVSFSSQKKATVYSPGTPQAVAQSYIRAVLEGHTEVASKYLAPQSYCTVDDLDRMGTVDASRVELDSADVKVDSAQIVVSVQLPFNGPFENFVYEKHTLRLVKVGGNWLLTGVPWPLYDCGVISK